MDIDNFDKWSGQFEAMLSQLAGHEKAMQAVAHRHPLADTEYLGTCATQASMEKCLKKLANDIRALGFCYNNLRGAIHMPKEQFDSLD
ncbi:MAG: hypothetical protein ACI9FJ_000612 [Alteromonadaceae bacterium]